MLLRSGRKRTVVVSSIAPFCMLLQVDYTSFGNKKLITKRITINFWHEKLFPKHISINFSSKKLFHKRIGINFSSKKLFPKRVGINFSSKKLFSKRVGINFWGVCNMKRRRFSSLFVLNCHF